MLSPPSVSSQTRQNTGCLLLAGIVIATLTEAIAGTALTLGKGHIIGDVYATPDEFAWLDIGYTTLKMIAFLMASWIATTVNLRIIVVAATVMITLASAATALTTRLDLLIVLRAFQGFSGGLLLVIGQTVIFRDFSPSRQPVLQALFATGAVVAPATLVPALQGWLLDSYSWKWIFFSVVPIGLLAAGLVLLSEETIGTYIPYRRFDWSGLLLASITLFCLVYVLNQGDRWNWFDEGRIRWLTGIGVVTLCLFISHQASRPEDEGLLELSVFRSVDFTFAFIVSFVAGAALFGSTYLIPSFAISVLAFTPTDTGILLLASSIPFVFSLFLSAFVFQSLGVSPIVTVPFGIVMIMIAMWLLSGSAGDSGMDDMLNAVLLRGLSLGFLFLSITLIAFSRMSARSLPAAIGIFNTGRQFGGLLGIACLQSLMTRNIAGNVSVLASHITAGYSAVGDRLGTSVAVLEARGMTTAAANQASKALLSKAVAYQSTVIAFDTAFFTIALLFVFGAPTLIVTKIILTRMASAKKGSHSTSVDYQDKDISTASPVQGYKSATSVDN
ncbi:MULTISPECIES: DHA2 family efflux MFS transporter permease subunit [Brucella]|uniref:DHA2 family efflux MFS transporter permease subunit n=1 Tax=Brucella TaxID=234 RepID=UPI00044A2F3A|nr:MULTISPECIES: DHA2 family efflux MFS transporter permease subunit [Brucella/Ochrobactrum group]MCR5944081.1 DHA2 family efflux MFS transporter permease subunit [Ochrobactrum sp. XJ1]EXL03145.1 MFS transporter [Brucella anthropi]MDG9793173.1 DHA2 family efflux MFS transporter permease subunit [Brucella anthropi]MDH0582964.1 DHA2 family efflux MFS transporter permease subunit [Brucella anthropi]MDH0819580.1 DHA2 family efflux MFS transporter permease subunit [Brucella anthropi]